MHQRDTTQHTVHNDCSDAETQKTLAPQYGNPAVSRMIRGFTQKELEPRRGDCSGNLISCGDLGSRKGNWNRVWVIVLGT